jgi:hypothetical protein
MEHFSACFDKPDQWCYDRRLAPTDDDGLNLFWMAGEQSQDVGERQYLRDSSYYSDCCLCIPCAASSVFGVQAIGWIQKIYIPMGCTHEY